MCCLYVSRGFGINTHTHNNLIMELGRVLELAANHFLRESHSSSKENLDKGLNLLQRAVDILENEARPSQAGTLAMRMMTIGKEDLHRKLDFSVLLLMQTTSTGTK